MHESARDTVLFVTLSPHLGGSNRSLETLLAHLSTHLRRVVAAPARGAFTETVAMRGLAEETRVFGALRTRPGLCLSAVRVGHQAWRWRRSMLAIHANGLAEAAVAAAAARLVKRPMIVCCRRGEIQAGTRRGVRLVRFLAPQVHWVAVSDSSRRAIVGTGSVPAEKVTKVMNPIDETQVVASFKTPRSLLTVGFIGDASRVKGFDLLPGIVERLNGEQVRWVIFANRRRSGELADAWERLLGRQDVEVFDKVKDVREAYARCDIVLCPSREESFCRVAAEAMANSLPVVGSDIPALREVVGNGQAGLLFPTHDVEAAARQLRRLLGDAELRARLGAEGSRRVSSFAPDRIAGAFEALYACDSSR